MTGLSWRRLDCARDHSLCGAGQEQTVWRVGTEAHRAGCRRHAAPLGGLWEALWSGYGLGVRGGGGAPGGAQELQQLGIDLLGVSPGDAVRSVLNRNQAGALDEFGVRWPAAAMGTMRSESPWMTRAGTSMR